MMAGSNQEATMPRFSTAPVDEVAPQRKQPSPSARSQMQSQYQEALRDALEHGNQALVIDLEPDDKPLTIRNRIKRAADVLGYPDITIRRKRERIFAYQSQTGEEE